jgi:hypothetical protein
MCAACWLGLQTAVPPVTVDLCRATLAAAGTVTSCLPSAVHLAPASVPERQPMARARPGLGPAVPPWVASRQAWDRRRRRRGPKVCQERGQADGSIARSAPLGLDAPLPPRGALTSTDALGHRRQGYAPRARREGRRVAGQLQPISGRRPSPPAPGLGRGTDRFGRCGWPGRHGGARRAAGGRWCAGGRVGRGG